jgi:hypothetical protein
MKKVAIESHELADEIKELSKLQPQAIVTTNYDLQHFDHKQSHLLPVFLQNLPYSIHLHDFRIGLIGLIYLMWLIYQM